MIVERVLVVGAGLAGLSAAIALARRGSAVTVVTREEQAEGASITITNRAVDAIEALGVLEACVAEGVTPIGSESIFAAMFDSEGKPLPVPPPPPRPDDRLPPYIAIYRPDLTRILTAAAIEAGVAIRSGVSFSALEDLSETVAVTLSDGTSDLFDLVVGAEGAHSPTRRVIFPALEPHYTGWMSFRIVIEDAPGGPAGFYSPPGGQGMLAIVRLPRGRLYLAAGKRMESRRLDQPEAVSLLDEVLAPYTAPLARAIRARLASDPPTVVARPFDTLLVPSPWHSGRVIIIGDAAHATTPNLASGGSIALEDGVVLAEELAAADSISDGLDAFMARRFTRCAMVVETSLKMMRGADTNADPAENAALRRMATAELIKPY